ncbi:2308_t:CDS:2 [Rhizophagus irregularis]|nr:2308_t:CDS:2 [Rhizophagus irregularis]
MNTITFIETSLAYNQFLLQQEFYRLFMKKFQDLKYLDIKSIKHQIFYLPEAKLRFESLYELKCDTSIDNSYFYGLAQLCQYIQRLIILNENPIDYHGIAELIGVQKNLKYFEWIDDDLLTPFSNNVPEPDHYEEILLALEKNANIINHLNIYFVCISRTSQKVLPKFHKLKTLRVSFNKFNEEQLKTCVYHDLETLEIKYIELKAASIIIENSGGYIKKILLESYEIDDHFIIENFYDDTLYFIHKVYEKCSSIEYLSLVFPPSKQHYNEFEKLLKICQNMKSLCFAIYMDKYLVKIRFPYDMGFSLDILEEFLEKWRSRPKLSILTCNNFIYEEENFVKLVNKYKNDGVIKDFRCESFENIYLYRNSDINNNSLVFIIVAAKDLDYQKFEVAVTG